MGFQLAENVDPGKAKPIPENTTPKKSRAPRPSMDPPSPQMERHETKSGMISGDPEKAGTEKIGGQVIRAKDGPGGE
jgi:hypothetical protein